jgi:demethylspheroidene O-methyltransferase
MSTHRDDLTLRTRWVMRRNATLGSARFQRWAARTPIVRGIARRRAAAQFDLVAGFVYSQILLAHVESGLIGFLAGELRSFDDIAAFLHLEADATERLLRAGAALQLVESPQPGVWTLGEQGAPLSANAGAMAMIRHHTLLYRDLADPLALLRQSRGEETSLSAFWSYASKTKDAPTSSAQPYSELMAATQPMVAGQALDAYDFDQHRQMLDIGGGSGGFTLQAMAAAPRLRFGIFDLPEVIDAAESRLSPEAEQGQIAFHRGSFKSDALPSGYDLITLVRILHDHDDDVVAALLTKIHTALPPRGRLLIVEPMAETASAPRMGDAYFGLYLWAMNSGRPRSQRVLRAMLQKAGFSTVKTVETALPLITSMLVATK